MNRISKKLKSALLVALVFAMMIPSISGLAVTQRQKALNAYDKWLSGSKVLVAPKGTIYWNMTTDQHEKFRGTKPSDVKFGLLYLDNDSIPELAVYDKNFCFSVLTYKNGKVVRLFGTFENFAIATKYYNKKNAFIAVGQAGVKVNKFFIKGSGKYFMKFQDDVKGTSEYFPNSNKDKGVSVSRIRSFMKNYTSGTAPTRISYHWNTKANRKNFLK